MRKQQDAAGTLANKFGVADEMDGVSQSLFRVQKNRATLKQLTTPFRSRKLAHALAATFPPFVVRPTLFVLAAFQMQESAHHMAVGILRIDRQCLVDRAMSRWYVAQ